MPLKKKKLIKMSTDLITPVESEMFRQKIARDYKSR